MSLEEPQSKFLDLMRGIKLGEEQTRFLKWIHTNWNLDQLKENDNLDDSSRVIFNGIVEDLRSLVPFNCTLPSEDINLPVLGPNSDCDPKTTLHVDEFLYDDDYLDELVEEGKFSRHYCQKCFSKDIKPLTFISHSVSVDRVCFMFRFLLHPLKHEIVLDVGSRFGPVLFGAYMYTSSPKIIGVEINSEFVKLQKKIVKKYKFEDRIHVICNNICNELDLLSTVDVVVLNNVFEFFADYNTAVTYWHILAQNIKPGSILITIPHLEDTFKYFKVNFDWKDWVEELEPYRQDQIVNDDKLESHLNFVKHYRVKKKFDAFTEVK